MSKLSETLDSVIDWPFQAKNGFLHFTRLVTLIGAGAAGIIAPIAAYDYNQQAKYGKNIKALDDKETIVFSSLKDCRSKGFSQNACDCSKKQAIDLGNSMGSAWSYSSEEACKDNHLLYHSKRSVVPVMTTVGNNIITTSIPTTNYYPEIIGWQAEKGNICNSVPLYSTREADMMQRTDGMKFKYNQ